MFLDSLMIKRPIKRSQHIVDRDHDEVFARASRMLFNSVTETMYLCGGVLYLSVSMRFVIEKVSLY